MRNKSGLTLIELVLVIVIISILVVSVFPQLIDITGSAETAAEEDTAGSVNTGITLFRANDAALNQTSGSYPASLDGLAVGTTCSVSARCFANVLSSGISDDSWAKTGANQYTHTTSGGSVVYIYNPAAGTFTKQ